MRNLMSCFVMAFVDEFQFTFKRYVNLMYDTVVKYNVQGCFQANV